MNNLPELKNSWNNLNDGFIFNHENKEYIINGSVSFDSDFGGAAKYFVATDASNEKYNFSLNHLNQVSVKKLSKGGKKTTPKAIKNKKLASKSRNSKRKSRKNRRKSKRRGF